MAAPIHAYLTSLISGTAMARSSNLTVPLSINGFEGWVPFHGIQPTTSSLSAGWEAYGYRSTDGGNTYETVASASFAITLGSAANDRKDMRLESGYWLLLIRSGGNTAVTFSFDIGTVDLITAIA
jgi:hypothetical protein